MNEIIFCGKWEDVMESWRQMISILDGYGYDCTTHTLDTNPSDWYTYSRKVPNRRSIKGILTMDAVRAVYPQHRLLHLNYKRPSGIIENCVLFVEIDDPVVATQVKLAVGGH